MQTVWIKDFYVNMDIKNKGVELTVTNADGTHRGDLYVTKTGLVWCAGRTTRKNGVKATWDEFIDWMK